MANKQGTNQIVDAFIGDKLIEARYIGQTKYFDPYTTLTGTLPLSFNARVAGALKNYRIYGDSDGSGVQTENLFDGNIYLVYTNLAEQRYGVNITTPGTYTIKTYGATNSYLYAATFDSNNDQIEKKNIVVNGTTSVGTFTISQGERLSLYSAISETKTVSEEKFNAWKPVIILGSTAPTTYIPFGYKIPISLQSGVTENLWDVDSWNGVTVQRGTIERIGNSFIITATGNDAYTKTYADSIYAYEVMPNEQYTLCWKVDNTSTFKGQIYVFTGENDGNTALTNITASAQSVTFTIPNNHHYLSFRLGVAYSGNTLTYSDIMLVKGSTAPDHYIPHRYTSNYDLMIGSTKLGAEEYVDYQEQKVYKRTENINDKPTASGGWSNVSNIPTKNENALRVRVDDIITLDSSKTYTVTVFPSTLQVAVMKLNQNGNVYNDTGWSTGNSWSIDLSYGIAITIKNQNGTEIYPSDVIGVVVSENPVSPQSYIPYLQPTDPPVPLPAIQTYQGENTLSSTETVGEVSVKGRISAISP